MKLPSKKESLEGVWFEPDEPELADDNLQTYSAVQITHPDKGGGEINRRQQAHGTGRQKIKEEMTTAA